MKIVRKNQDADDVRDEVPAKATVNKWLLSGRHSPLQKLRRSGRFVTIQKADLVQVLRIGIMILMTRQHRHGARA